ncbi:MAG: UDP-phosphate galactose phosphotransferase, partial [Pseudomonadota bacterium]
MFHIRIFKHYLPLQYIILALIEYWLLVLAVYLAVSIRLPWESINPLDFQDPYAYRCSVFAITMLCCTLSLGVYESKLREGFSGLAVRSVVSFFLLGSAALTVLYYIFPLLQLGRGVLSIAVVFSLMLCLITRALFFLVVDISHLRRKILVLGAGARAEEVRGNVESGDRSSGCQI